MTMNEQEVRKGADQSKDLSIALVELCRGYPIQVSTFAVISAAATLLVASQSKSAINAAPGMLKRMINMYAEVLKRKNDK